MEKLRPRGGCDLMKVSQLFDDIQDWKTKLGLLSPSPCLSHCLHTQNWPRLYSLNPCAPPMLCECRRGSGPSVDRDRREAKAFPTSSGWNHLYMLGFLAQLQSTTWWLAHASKNIIGLMAMLSILVTILSMLPRALYAPASVV